MNSKVRIRRPRMALGSDPESLRRVIELQYDQIRELQGIVNQHAELMDNEQKKLDRVYKHTQGRVDALHTEITKITSMLLRSGISLSSQDSNNPILLGGGLVGGLCPRVTVESTTTDGEMLTGSRGEVRWTFNCNGFTVDDSVLTDIVEDCYLTTEEVYGIHIRIRDVLYVYTVDGRNSDVVIIMVTGRQPSGD